MHELPVGSAARIIAYTAHTAFTERLREFGLIPGTIIKVLRRAPFNGPMEIQYRSSRIVVRPEETGSIRFERI